MGMKKTHMMEWAKIEGERRKVDMEVWIEEKSLFLKRKENRRCVVDTLESYLIFR